MSLSGPASARARLPTAARAMPLPCRPSTASAQTVPSQSRVSVAMACRRAGPAPGALKPRAPARSRRRAARSICSTVMSLPFGVVGSERVDAALTGPHADHVVDGDRPDLAVADAPRLRGLEDDVGHAGGVHVVDEDLDPHLRHEVDGVLGASVDLAVAALPAIPGGLADGHPRDAVG